MADNPYTMNVFHRSFALLGILTLSALAVSGCQSGGVSAVNGSPAGFHSSNNADGPAPSDTFSSSSDSPGGVVSAPVDVDGWDPNAPGNAHKGDAPDTDSADTNAPTVEYDKAPSTPPPPPPPSAPSSEGNEASKEPVLCGPENGWSRHHSVTFTWKDGIAFDWMKQEGAGFVEKMTRALESQFDALIKDRPLQRTDLCTVKPPSNMPNQITFSLVFKDSVITMPAETDGEFTFHSKEEFLEFLSHAPLAAAFKLPGQ